MNIVSSRFAPLLLIVILLIETSHEDVNEEALYKYLLHPSRYEKDVRPTTNPPAVTNVTFGFLLNQVVEMDERNQILTTRSWLNINWLDSRLTWNSTEWDGIESLHIPYQRIWKPDIILVNNAERQYHEAVVSTDIMSTAEGNITWLFSAIFKSSCKIQVRYYPFDDQECELRFAAWSHDATEIILNLITEKGDLSSYMNNTEFDLTELTARREILPCILISSMALLGFFMPPQTGEKINMCITTILSMGVYLQSITESIPPTSEAVPLIGLYYVSSLTMVCLATCINVITLNIYRNGANNQGSQVPYWMRKYVLGYLASIMHMTIRRPDSIALLKTLKTQQTSIRQSSIVKELDRMKRLYRKEVPANSVECDCLKRSSTCRKNDIELLLMDVETDQNTDHKLDPSNDLRNRRASKDFANLRRIKTSQLTNELEKNLRVLLKSIYQSLQQHEIREEVTDARRRIRWQWHQLAKVIDRFLLVMFAIVTLSTVIVFLVIPVDWRNANPDYAQR